MTLFRFPPRLMVLQVGRSTSTGKSSEARSANGLEWSRVSSQARIKIPCPAQPAALTTIPRWQPLAAQHRWAGTDPPPRPPAGMPQKAPSIARRCPHDIRSTKGGDTPTAKTALNQLSEDFPTGLV